VGCAFVAYGASQDRISFLEFALGRAEAAGEEILVHRFHEDPATAGEDLRAEVAEVLERVAPDVTSEVRIDDRGVYSEDTNVSKQKRLIVTILEDKRDFMDVAMGNIERGPLGELTLASVTEAVLETHEILVLLIPI